MPKIIFIAHDGTTTPVEIATGQTLLTAALNHNVKGIDGDCGGQCGCATCHVFVDAPWADKLPSPQPNEDEMLNFTAERMPNSRLACQLTMTDALDGITVHMPSGQH